MIPNWAFAVVIVLCLPYVAYYIWSLYKLTKEQVNEITFSEVQDGVAAITVVIKSNKLDCVYMHMEDGTINKVCENLRSNNDSTSSD